MDSLYFAASRLLMDEELVRRTKKDVSEFYAPQPYADTFTLRAGDPAELEQRFAAALAIPAACANAQFSVHRTADGWAIAYAQRITSEKTLFVCSRDYGDITAYVEKTTYFDERHQTTRERFFPFSGGARFLCEAGIGMRGGLPLHASLVEYDGRGIVFLGPSGMGKSTQAKLWRDCLGADFISGDRPCMRRVNGAWYGCGMPWDGKDAIHRQKSVKLCALIALEQAPKNEISRLTKTEAMRVLLRQTMLPMWDRAAMDAMLVQMDKFVSDVPMYILKNLADAQCVEMTLSAIMGG